MAEEWSRSTRSRSEPVEPVLEVRLMRGAAGTTRILTIRGFPTEIEARAAAAGIVLEINVNDPRVQTHALTISQLAEHYRHRELSADNTWKSYSTKKGYENYLKRWIVPKWGEFGLCKIRPT